MKTAPTSDEEPRWLTDEEQRTWRVYVHAVTLLEDHLDRQLQRDAGMPHVYYGLLVCLSGAPAQRLRMTELAMMAKITRSRLSHAIARLEKNGWVRREDCPSDKRGQFAVLTKQGEEVLRRTAPGHVGAVCQALFDRISDEQRQTLHDVMDIIAEGLQPKDANADLPWLR
ncbi:MAG: MarR family transcriptional regulator [Streptomyces turgidiscabies]|nr:MarR family transcriptional regulator [Streptomyces turgidiscabies]